MPLTARAEALKTALAKLGVNSKTISTGDTEHEIEITGKTGWVRRLLITVPEVEMIDSNGETIYFDDDDIGHRRLLGELT